MSREKTILDARHEWDYREDKSTFGESYVRTAIPAQLRFAAEPEQDTERFHDALEERGLQPVSSEPGSRSSDGYVHYDGEVSSGEKYSRARVLVFRENLVRIYPRDEHVSDRPDLGAIIEALEEGFGAELEHHPIEEAEA